jgi:hypothetical protein
MSHVRIGVYALTSGTAQEVADQAREGMLSVFQAQPGFRAYGLAQTQEGKLVSVRLTCSGQPAQPARFAMSDRVTDRGEGTAHSPPCPR